MIGCQLDTLKMIGCQLDTLSIYTKFYTFYSSSIYVLQSSTVPSTSCRAALCHLRPAEQHCAIYVLQSSTVPSTSCRAALCHLSSSMSLKRQLKYQMMLTHVIAADCIVRRRFASNCAMSRLVFCTATTCRSTTLSTQSTNHHQ